MKDGYLLIKPKLSLTATSFNFFLSENQYVMVLTESVTLNYSDVFYSFFTNNDSICHNKAKL